MKISKYQIHPACIWIWNSMPDRAAPLYVPRVGAAMAGSAAAATATCEVDTARPREGSKPRQPPPG